MGQRGESEWEVPRHEGWLWKKGGKRAIIKPWKKRWMVLQNNKLFYFLSPSDKSFINFLDLDNAASIYVQETQHKQDGYFFAIEYPQKTYNLMTKTDADMRAWVDALNRSKIGYSNDALTMHTVWVYYEDGTRDSIQLNDKATLKDFCTEVVSLLMLPPAVIPYFEIYAQSEHLETPLEPLHPVKKIRDEWKQKYPDTDEDDMPVRFLFRASMPMPASLDALMTSLPAVHLLYLRAVHLVLNGYFPLFETDTITLAALHMHVTLGDYLAVKHTKDFFADKIDKYLPFHIIKNHPPDYWLGKILTKYAARKGASKYNAQLEYLKIVRAYPFYGAAYYQVSYSQTVSPTPARKPPATTAVPNSDTTDIFAAVNHNGLHLIKKSTCVALSSFPLTKIAYCEYKPSTNIITIRVRHLEKNITLTFTSPEGGYLAEAINELKWGIDPQHHRMLVSSASSSSLQSNSAPDVNLVAAETGLTKSSSTSTLPSSPGGQSPPSTRPTKPLTKSLFTIRRTGSGTFVKEPATASDVTASPGSTRAATMSPKLSAPAERAPRKFTYMRLAARSIPLVVKEDDSEVQALKNVLNPDDAFTPNLPERKEEPVIIVNRDEDDDDDDPPPRITLGGSRPRTISAYSPAAPGKSSPPQRKHTRSAGQNNKPSPLLIHEERTNIDDTRRSSLTVPSIHLRTEVSPGSTPATSPRSGYNSDDVMLLVPSTPNRRSITILREADQVVQQIDSPRSQTSTNNEISPEEAQDNTGASASSPQANILPDDDNVDDTIHQLTIDWATEERLISIKEAAIETKKLLEVSLKQWLRSIPQLPLPSVLLLAKTSTYLEQDIELFCKMYHINRHGVAARSSLFDRSTLESINPASLSSDESDQLIKSLQQLTKNVLSNLSAYLSNLGTETARAITIGTAMIISKKIVLMNKLLSALPAI